MVAHDYDQYSMREDVRCPHVAMTWLIIGFGHDLCVARPAQAWHIRAAIVGAATSSLHARSDIGNLQNEAIQGRGVCLTWEDTLRAPRLEEQERQHAAAEDELLAQRRGDEVAQVDQRRDAPLGRAAPYAARCAWDPSTALY